MANATNGKSWKTTLAGVVTFVGGLGATVAQLGLQDTQIGKIVMAVSVAAMALGAGFGLVAAKDSNVHGAGSSAQTIG